MSIITLAFLFYSMMSSMSMGDFISPTGSNLSPMENSALRVSHEHTDSGLGADQDYAYSSERYSLLFYVLIVNRTKKILFRKLHNCMLIKTKNKNP